MQLGFKIVFVTPTQAQRTPGQTPPNGHGSKIDSTRYSHSFLILFKYFLSRFYLIIHIYRSLRSSIPSFILFIFIYQLLLFYFIYLFFYLFIHSFLHSYFICLLIVFNSIIDSLWYALIRQFILSFTLSWRFTHTPQQASPQESIQLPPPVIGLSLQIMTKLLTKVLCKNWLQNCFVDLMNFFLIYDIRLL